MTIEPFPVDPKKNTKAPGGERHHGGRVKDPNNTGSAPTNPAPAKPCDDSGCATPKASDAGASAANMARPQPGSPGQQGRADRPGAHVKTDRNGKTYEGKTGVSGETAEDASDI